MAELISKRIAVIPGPRRPPLGAEGRPLISATSFWPSSSLSSSQVPFLAYSRIIRLSPGAETPRRPEKQELLQKTNRLEAPKSPARIENGLPGLAQDAQKNS
jgi:hypothetical protein